MDLQKDAKALGLKSPFAVRAAYMRAKHRIRTPAARSRSFKTSKPPTSASARSADTRPRSTRSIRTI